MTVKDVEETDFYILVRHLPGNTENNDGRSLGQDLNPGSLKYETEVVTTWL
jgi:hypothetical protein